MPASPRSTKTPLRPAAASVKSRSSTWHSAWRPRSDIDHSLARRAAPVGRVAGAFGCDEYRHPRPGTSPGATPPRTAHGDLVSTRAGPPRSRDPTRLDVRLLALTSDAPG